MGQITHYECDQCKAKSEDRRLMPETWSYIALHMEHGDAREKETDKCFCSLNCFLMHMATEHTENGRYILDGLFLIDGAIAYKKAMDAKQELEEKFTHAKRITITGGVPKEKKATPAKGSITYRRYNEAEKQIIREFPNDFEAALNKLQTQSPQHGHYDRQKIYAQWWAMHKKKDKGATLSKDIRQEFDVPNGTSKPVATTDQPQGGQAGKSSYKEVKQHNKHK